MKTSTILGMTLLWLWLFSLPALLAWRIHSTWPGPRPGGAAKKVTQGESASGTVPEDDNGEVKLDATDVAESTVLLLVIYCGAMGASIHALSSYLYFVGNEKFAARWVPWYLGRPIIGLSLATAFYFAFRAGYVGLGSKQSGVVNLYGVCGISAIVGLFSTQAMEKLKQIAEAVFVSPAPQSDSLEAEVPAIEELEPAELPAGADGQFVIRGSGLSDKSNVYVGGFLAEKKSRSDISVEVFVKKEWLTADTEIDVFVKNSTPGGGKSQVRKLKIT